jgi:hypothetical protein
MHAEDQHGGRPRVRHDRSRRVDTVCDRHRAIHDDNLRLELPRKGDRLRAVAGLPDHLDRRIVVQHAAEAAPDQRMVVHEEHGNPGADFHKYGGIRPPMHPASRRCSSVKYSRYSPSSRLARRAPRRPRCVTVFMKGST